MSQKFKPGRRSIQHTLTLGTAITCFGTARAADEHSQPSSSTAAAAGGHTSFASLKQIKAGVLNVSYAEDGPADGPPVILLHGWPYDIDSCVDVAPILAKAGYHVLVPYLRGYGTCAGVCQPGQKGLHHDQW